jgi:hypothetical protein
VKITHRLEQFEEQINHDWDAFDKRTAEASRKEIDAALLDLERLRLVESAMIDGELRWRLTDEGRAKETAFGAKHRGLILFHVQERMTRLLVGGASIAICRLGLNLQRVAMWLSEVADGIVVSE